jgi:hypothetical protein
VDIKTLVCKIVLAKKNYYLGKASISDQDYDELEKELRKKDPNHPILYAVGYDDSYDWWLTHYDFCVKSSAGEHYYVPSDSFENAPHCMHCLKS